MKKLVLLLLLSVLAISGLLAEGSQEEGSKNVYPKRPVEVVIPFGEGGASDIFARKFSELMSEGMPQPVLPINKKGSGGLVGMLHAAQQKNDGYTILEITPSHIIADALEKSPEVKLMRDFEPLCRIQSDIYIIGVLAGSKFKSFEELVTYGRENEVTFAGISPGGLDDITLNALADATGMKIQFIPYKSGSEVKAAVLGGEVDIYLDKIISAVNYIREGSIKPLVVLNDERIEQIDAFKGVPSTVELGYDVTIGSWRGFCVKKDTPVEIKEYLMTEMKKVYDSAEYQTFAEQNLVNIRSGFLTADEFEAQWEKEYTMFDGIARKVGLK